MKDYVFLSKEFGLIWKSKYDELMMEVNHEKIIS